VAKKKYYAVVIGRKPGIYDEWFGPNGAEAQVKGLNGAVYKSFASHTEAEAWYKSRSDSSTVENHLTRPIDNSGAEYIQLHQEALEAGKVVIYTDGGCDGNPGKGSYGVVLLHKTRRKELSGGYALTTNNRMELMAAIAGLETLTKPAPVLLFSDSAYLIDAMQKGWVERWHENNWQRKEDGKLLPVKNADLWQRLYKLCHYYDVRFVKVRGHAGIAENERCHILASQAMQRNDLPKDEGYSDECAPLSLKHTEETMAISDLDLLIRSMEPTLNDGRYVFVSLPLESDFSALQPIATIREQEGWSLILDAATAEQHGLEALFEAAWITLRVHSDLQAVGLTAAFATALGQAGISCNVVAGAYHDHIFVPYAQAERAVQCLRNLQQQASSS
jgi:Uncharacterized protein conserved in bacteria